MKLNLKLVSSLIVLFSIVTLVGGVNWLVTAINTWSKDEETYDLLQDQFSMNRHAANIIYILVFACTLGLVTIVLPPAVKHLI